MDMEPKIKKISELGLEKKWAGKFNLLVSSLNVKVDIAANKRELGIGFSNILYIHKDGITSYYRRKKETKEFGEFLVRKIIEDKDIVYGWEDRLIKASDDVRKAIKDPSLDLEKYSIFESSVYKFHPYMMAVYVTADYLPKELLEELQSVLEKNRLYSESIYDEIEQYFRKLAKIINDKEGYGYDLILCLFEDELIEYLKTGNLPDKEILEKRKELFAVYSGTEGTCEFFGKEVDEIEADLLNIPDTNNFMGTTAYPGKVKGAVRIVHDPSDANDFNDGDILVTGMTRPEYVPLIEKSAGFITDAGGILSHAAITAREMKKPCIVGTEIATKVLKDGDIVELDADKGVVKILE